MSQDETKQEKQAAAEERDEILEEANENDGVDMGSVATPSGSTVAGGSHVDQDPESAEEAAEELTEDSDADSEEGDTPKAAAKTTKAGKNSAKAQREAEEEETRKATAATRAENPVEEVSKRIIHVPNPKNRHGKAYLAALEKVDRNKHYELDEAIKLIKDTAKNKFDPSVELHINLGVDPRQADQMVRATVTLPAGTGKTLRIAVLAGADKHAAAKKAGADIVSDGDLIAKIEKGELDFDILISSPDMMAQLGKVARVLGPRGLMPNPKSGTVTPNVAQAVEQSKGGKVEFRIDKQAIIHLAIGKASFTEAQLSENLLTAIDAVMKAKPAATKGTYVKAMSMASTMGPGIKLDVTKAIAAANPKK